MGVAQPPIATPAAKAHQSGKTSAPIRCKSSRMGTSAIVNGMLSTRAESRAEPHKTTNSASTG